MEQDICFEKQTGSSSIDADTDNLALKSTEQDNCFEKQTRSPITVIDDADNTNLALEGLESENYLKEKHSENDNFTYSNDSAPAENLEEVVRIATSAMEDGTNFEKQTGECAENEEEIKSQASKRKRKRDLKASKRKRKWDLFNQSLSLPYYKMPRPDFHEFTKNVAKNLEVSMKVTQPLNFKHQQQTLPLQRLHYPKKSLFEKNFVGHKEYPDIVLSEGPSIAKRLYCPQKAKESSRLRREDFFQSLKDQMQKKKEAAFDRLKEIEIKQADEKMYGSDAEEFDKVIDNENSRSPSPANKKDSVASRRNQVSYSEDSCTLPEGKEIFKSNLEPTSIEATHDLLSIDEDNSNEKNNASESFMDSTSVSLSIPSYQPNGGFAHHSDLSSDSCHSDSEKVLPSENNASQVSTFGLDEVSTICSGCFLSMEEERPWTPSSDSQVHREDTLSLVVDDGGIQDSEELEPANKKFEDTLSPPRKKYKKDLIGSESNGISSSLKIDEIMQDVYEQSPVNVDNLSQNTNINYRSRKELTDDNADQQSGETFNDDDAEEIHVRRIKKCKPLIDSSDDEDENNLLNNLEDEDETNLPNNLTDEDETNVPNNLDEDETNVPNNLEALPQNQPVDVPGQLRISDFLDEEAELSGDEMSSDESDGGEDGDDEAEQIIPEDLPAEEELKEQVANIHFKHERDDDARIVKRLQQDFLPEGELYSDGSGRRRTFCWSHTVSDNVQNEVLSESDLEDSMESPMLQDKIKWRQETSLIQNCSDSETSDVEGKEKTQTLKRLPVCIIGRALSLQAVFETKKHGVSSPFIRRRGSLIHVAGTEGVRLNVSSTVQRKKVLFQTLSRTDKVNSSTSKVLDKQSVFEKLL